MSSGLLSTYLRSGTSQERLASTPLPPAQIWHETDTGLLFVYDGGWLPLTATPAAPPKPGGSPNQIQVNAAGAFGGLASGSAGQVLISAGPNGLPAFGTLPTAGGILLDSRTYNNANGAPFTAFSASFDHYILEFLNFVPSADSALYLQVSSDGGASYDGSALYYGGAVYMPNASSGLNLSATASGMNYGAQNGFVVMPGVGKDFEGISGTVRFFNPLSATYRKDIAYNVVMSGTIGGFGGFYTGAGGGTYINAMPVNGVQLYFGGLIVSGAARLYGVVH